MLVLSSRAAVLRLPSRSRSLWRPYSSSPQPGHSSALSRRDAGAAKASDAVKSTGPSVTTPSTSPSPSPSPPASIWQRLGPLTRAANAYSRSQRKRPYTTQLVGAFFIYLCADLSAQRIGGQEYNAVRTGRTVLIGLVAAIPYYRWFVFLSGNFNYASKALSIATKAVVNQLVLAPTFSTYFFGAQALLSGESMEATARRIKETVPVSWINALKVWPATVAFSMAFLPFEFRSIFAGLVAVGWQTYLSFLNRKAELLEEERWARTNAGDLPERRVEAST
ncbi:Mpv17/PMP22 family protein [Moelleriella libera RCEF 2490]|uniref:Mpv17/PMP22 family protein n=1 Tax=Moelleriella libera RCEF 2490 TaxID=1081109 RepID=A0A166NUD1_9HYPO|nr:Mpv17/PMP22 family protein [Moelleriella libera RCEF 2490]